MKIKELKPRMAIHCTSREQEEYLVKNNIAEKWILSGSCKNWLIVGNDLKIHEYIPEMHSDGSYGEDTCKRLKYTCVEFAEIFKINDAGHELTRDKILSICSDICSNSQCKECPLRKYNCLKWSDIYDDEITKICEQCVKDNKKTIEIKWVYEVSDGYSSFNVASEDEAIEICERYVKANPDRTAYYRKICRAKDT